MTEKNTKIGIALSGGGARGAAHAGLLKALGENGFVPHHVTGVSAGAIIGALFCGGITPNEMLNLFNIKSLFRLFSLRDLKEGLIDTKYFKNIITEQIPHNSFENLEIKLSVGVTNLTSGDFEVLESGDLALAAAASSAVPLMIKPVRIGDILYVDGGIINNLLIEPLIESCDIILGSIVHSHQQMEGIGGMRAIGSRVFEIIAWNNIAKSKDLCDFEVEIEEAMNFNLFDFRNSEALFEIGYNKMNSLMPKFKQAIADLGANE